MSKRELGVVVARFQTPALTSAHIYLLTQVATRVNRVLILLGSPPVVGTKKNPIEVSIRMRMVMDWWTERYPDGPEAIVLPLLDCPSDEEWVMRVDQTINAININGSATVFCGPDGAGPQYANAGGKWPIEVLDSMGPHASKLRAGMLPRYTEDFRAGIIYAVERRIVAPHAVVDVVIKEGETVLLGHKVIDGTKWRLIGGFVDVGDDSLERAVRREVLEETGLEVSEPMYVGSARVEDWRYRAGPETIISSLFYCQRVFGEARARDDIDALGWFPIGEVDANIHPVHAHLWQMTKKVQ